MGSITGQAGTNLGPLTTVWTPSPSCTAMIPFCEACDSGYLAQRCDLSIEGAGSLRDNTDCWPPVQSRVASPTHPFVGWGFYSPGIQCPTGYTSACTAEYNKRPEWPLQFTLIESETAVGCCPMLVFISSVDLMKPSFVCPSNTQLQWLRVRECRWPDVYPSSIINRKPRHHRNRVMLGGRCHRHPRGRLP